MNEVHILEKNSGTQRFPLDPEFSTRPGVFHRTPRFPPDPAFSSRPRVVHTRGPRTPGPRTPGPQPRVFHIAAAHSIFFFAQVKLHRIRINWHVHSQSEFRNCCLYNNKPEILHQRVNSISCAKAQPQAIYTFKYINIGNQSLYSHLTLF